MSLRFACPHCLRVLTLNDRLAGKRGACPFCGDTVYVPGPGDPSEGEEGCKQRDPPMPLSKEGSPPRPPGGSSGPAWSWR